MGAAPGSAWVVGGTASVEATGVGMAGAAPGMVGAGMGIAGTATSSWRGTSFSASGASPFCKRS